MKERRSFSLPVVGGTSLLVIFAVLCLTVFALLSVSTVRANERLAQEAETAVYGYYKADCAAEEILARLRAGQRPAGVKEENGIYSYTCPISETQVLAVAVEVAEPEYTVLRWQAISTAEWQEEEYIHVWDGTSE